jgi:hypothetical protein
VYVCGQSTMQHAYTSEQLGFFFASHTQILCNHYACHVLIQPTCVHALVHYSLCIPQKLGFLKLRDFFHQDLRHYRNFDASMRSSSCSLSQNRSSIMLKRCTQNIHKRYSQNVLQKMYFSQETLASYLYSSYSRSLNPLLGHLTYFPHFSVNHFP